MPKLAHCAIFRIVSLADCGGIEVMSDKRRAGGIDGERTGEAAAGGETGG